MEPGSSWESSAHRHKTVRRLRVQPSSAAEQKCCPQDLEEKASEELGCFPEWRRVGIEAAGGGKEGIQAASVTSTCLMFLLFPP